jgi:GT2 family glycosyltransferase
MSSEKQHAFPSDPILGGHDHRFVGDGRVRQDEILDNLLPALVRLDQRLVRVENSIIFKMLRSIGRLWSEASKAILAGDKPQSLRKWQANNSMSTEVLATLHRSLTKNEDLPLVSILVWASPDTKSSDYDALLKSLDSQPYKLWELLPAKNRKGPGVADTGQSRPPSDRRIDADHNTNQSRWPSLEAASGQLILFLRLGDTLQPEALTLLAHHFLTSGAAAIYTDEAVLLSDGRTILPILKPDYSPHLLPGPSYPGRLLAVHRVKAMEVGSLRPDCGADADYDLFLRMADSGCRIFHLPKVLYTRKTSSPEENSEPLDSLRRSLARRNESATVAPDRASGLYQIQRLPEAVPPASLIIASKTPSLLKACLEGITRKTAYPHYEIIVAHHESEDESTNQAMRKLISAHSAASIAYSGPFNYSLLNNRAAAIAKGHLLVFLNDDVTPLVPEWLHRLAGTLAVPGVGVVGARLQYPNGSIQHAGIVVGLLGCLGHVGRHARHVEMFPWLSTTRNVSAVTGACLAIRRQLFDSLGGFDSDFDVNFNDVDLCFRVRRSGLEVLVEGGALLQHDECQTRDATVRLDEFYRLYLRWGAVLSQADPYYSPALTLDHEVPALRLK